MSTNLSDAAQLIWCADAQVNQHAAFRRSFELGDIRGVPEIRIAAGTDYVLWVNGAEIGRGQYSDFPDRKTWSVFRAPNLRSGRNVIAILAHHAGETFFNCLKTAPGVIAELSDDSGTLVATDGNWRATEERAWRAGSMPRRTPQIHFTTEFDARNFPSDWTRESFDDGDWPRAEVSDAWRCVGERPVPPCQVGSLCAGTPVKFGTLRRSSSPADPDRFAEQMALDQYCFTPAMPESAGDDDGVFAIFDLGRESVGFVTFEVELPGGAVIDYAHGEHLDDGVVRMAIGGRLFADRYIARAGRQRHELYFSRVGARYLQLNITRTGGEPVKIHYAGIRPWTFPLPQAAEFVCDDLPSAALRRTAQRTLEMCMHEHFEDCPWREQSMYAYDSRNQALYGYYLWGNYEFVRESFSLLGYSYPLRQDHLMMLCAPMEFDRTIPIFSFVWVTAAYEHYLYSGDNSLFERFRPMVADLIANALSHFDEATQLYHTGTDPVQWNFYEWSPGLEADGCRADEFHAAYNFYLLELLESYARLLGDEAGAPYRARAERLRPAVDAAFWDEARGAYASKKIGGVFAPDYHDHLQYLALLTGVAVGERAEKVLDTLRDHRLHYATLSALPYLVNALMPVSPEAREYVCETIRSTYGAMLEKGATTLWETQTGGWDFDRAGSLCHGWSSLPIYYQGGVLLGVRPTAPGFASFEVRPYADKYTHFACGSVPTPHGEIRVCWQRRADGIHLSVEHPPELVCEIASYPECPVVGSAVHAVEK